MRIGAYLGQYLPDWCAGSEVSIHETLLGLQRRGHEVRVLVESYTRPDWEGITLLPATDENTQMIRSWADVGLTQVNGATGGIACFRGHAPLVHFIHVDGTIRDRQFQSHSADLIVYNSESMASRLPWPGRTMVMPPIVDPRRYATTRGTLITLINLNENKGASVFYKVAKMMPYRSFLAVRGAYGRQIEPRPPLRNVEVVDHTPAIREVYSRTRLLLMPSLSETWGRVALEAACSGIPTIAHKSPGVEEALGRDAIFADRRNPRQWVDRIRQLDDEARYARASERSLARVAEMSPDVLVGRLETELLDLVKSQKRILTK